MIAEDRLIKAIDKNKQVRITIASTTGVVEEAHRRHNTSATASAALGRVLTAALIMGSDYLKAEQDLLTIKVDGNGICGHIIATVNSTGQVRGLISNPQADLPSKYPGKLAVGELVGKDGFLEVVKDLGLKQPFTGRTDLISGEIAEDLSHYLLMSEQIPSLVSLGVLVAADLSIQAAGGLIIQALPGADDLILEVIEKNVMGLGSISHLINEADSLKDLLDKVLEGVEYEVVGDMPVEFRCTCNYERLAGILSSLSEEDIIDLGHSGDEIEICCNFCNEAYHYKVMEILELKRQKALG